MEYEYAKYRRSPRTIAVNDRNRKQNITLRPGPGGYGPGLCRPDDAISNGTDRLDSRQP